MMPRRLGVLLAATALALAPAAVVACGGDGDADGERQEEEEAAAERAVQQQAEQAAREKALAARVRRLIPIASAPQQGKSRKQQLRSADAEFQLWQIAGRDLSAVRPLLQALKRRDYELIANLPTFYIALGKPGSEPILAETVGELYPSGNPEYSGLPFEFLGAGNPKLERAVIEELESHGYTVTGEGGPSAINWGASGAYE